MKKKDIRIVVIAIAILGLGIGAFLFISNQSKALDNKEIEKIAYDYIEGWYEGSTERMDNALSENLVKRLVRNDTCETLDKDTMMSYTKLGGGKWEIINVLWCYNEDIEDN